MSSIQDVRSFGAILGIWAHPDDEIFSMAGIMAAALSNGQQVACVTATRGEKGSQDTSRWPADQLAEIRTRELERAYRVLGVKHHQWLDYADGGCSQVNEDEATSRLASLINQYQPDSILTFDASGMTGHPDHKCVSRWSTLARDKAGSAAVIYHTALTREQYEAYQEADAALNIFFNIDTPVTCDNKDCDCCFELDNDLYRLKIEALKAMPSQTEVMLENFEPKLRPALGREAFIKEKS